METENIYGEYAEALSEIKDKITREISEISKRYKESTGEGIYEHLIARIKSDESMREKCDRKGLPQTAKSALIEIKDAIGIRIVCSFINDIYTCVDEIKKLDGVRVINEKDYIKNVKPNGYRSLHMIIGYKTDLYDANGNKPGEYFVEIQLRTIAMDSWASLEHQLKYKKTIGNQKLIVGELKKCADELAGCDISMQTIRDLINGEK
ncbi:MAG: GTP pyrophosphokinase family protein [Lachnospiraceae bacterium]|nr:GTP pyrophosphokinase family protein [Lachnospiraceae bacterium]